ncbi:MAG TPA: hypothetical protein VNA16_01810 [Abditibacteriaceae bacterium]|nr:hypothetical protein [Abditibacteriaceae bacterium]
MKQFSFIKLLLLFLCGSCMAGQAAPVRVAGRVMNETRRTAAAGVLVQLFYVGKNAKQQKTVANVRTDAGGRFDCGPLTLGTDDLLIARANWQGNFYDQAWVYEASGQLKSMAGTVAPGQMKLGVYDATTKPPPLSFQVHHLAINAKENDLKCIERIVVLNPSRLTFAGEGAQRVAVRLALPAGAREVRLDPDVDGKLVKTADGYGIVKPIVPTQQDERNILKNNVVIISYVMKWPLSLPWSRHIDLSRKIIYPTNFFFVVREESDRKLHIDAPQLGADEVEQVNTREGMQTRIVNMTGRPMTSGPMASGPMAGDATLKPGAVVAIRVARPLNSLVWVFVLFVVALCLLVPLSLVNRRRGAAVPDGASASQATSQATSKSAEPTVEASVYRGTPTRIGGMSSLPETFAGHDFALTDEARSIVEAIAKLDDAWESGTMDAGKYQSERATWKTKLIDLLESTASSESSR